MNMTRQLRSLLPLPLVFFMIGTISFQAQTIDSELNSVGLNLDVRERATASRSENDIRLAHHAIAALKRLHDQVILYRSLSDFESNGRLARVAFDTFNAELAHVTREVQPLLADLSDDKLRTQLLNALYSYRDGAFWWSRIEQPRVIPIQRLGFVVTNLTPAETFFADAVPYTVVIHWRQANEFLRKAERLMAVANTHKQSRCTEQMEHEPIQNYIQETGSESRSCG
jgi:hypothetical protein